MARRAELESAIHKHQALYDAGTPEITDAAFDALIAELRAVAPQSPVLDTLSSENIATTIKHKTPMLSLEKAYTLEAIDRWFDMLESVGDVGEGVVLMPKLDGVSCAVVYENGELVYAATRGNGAAGENVTHIVSRLMPRTLPHFNHRIELRGEIVIPKHEEPALKARGFANLRNAAAGLLNRNVFSEEHRALHFVVFDLIEGSPNQLKYLVDRLHFAQKLGFQTAYPSLLACRDTVAEHIAGVSAGINDTGSMYVCHYQTDGLVLRANNDLVWRACGSTAHHPNGSIAWKFQGETRMTKLVGVEWQVSRTGTVTPVAVVEPVELSGAVVTRATLHSYRDFRSFKCMHVGADVAMTRRGGVIPHVESVAADTATIARGEKITAPSSCPSCGGPLVIDGAFLLCERRTRCPDAVIGSLLHYLRVVEYDGVGPAMVSSAYAEGVFDDLPSLYRASEADLATLPGWGASSAASFVSLLPRELPAETMLRALGIDGIGKTVSDRLIKDFKSYDALIAWAKGGSTMPDIKGVGASTLHSLHEALRVRADELLELTEHVTVTCPAEATGPLVGKSFVFTGRLTDMERGEAQEAVRALGATTPSGVTKDLSYLVVGALAKDEQATKRDKAHKYNAKGSSIKIISEDDFLELLRASSTL